MHKRPPRSARTLFLRAELPVGASAARSARIRSLLDTTVQRAAIPHHFSRLVLHCDTMSERSVFTMRAERRTLRALEEEARRYGVPPRTLAERMIEEGVKMRRHPGIVFVDRGRGARDAVLAGRPRLSAWMVVQVARANRTLAGAAKWLSLDEPSIERALAYAKNYPQEIDQAIRENDEAFERVKRLHPPALAPVRRPRRAARPR